MPSPEPTPAVPEPAHPGARSHEVRIGMSLYWVRTWPMTNGHGWSALNGRVGGWCPYPNISVALSEAREALSAREALAPPQAASQGGALAAIDVVLQAANATELLRVALVDVAERDHEIVELNARLTYRAEHLKELDAARREAIAFLHESVIADDPAKVSDAIIALESVR